MDNEAVLVDVSRLECCGVWELDGIAVGSSKSIVDEVCRQFYATYPHGHPGTVFPAFILFSEAGKRGGNYGASLAKYIVNSNLGMVTRTDRRKNPNTGNLVRVYLWAVAHGRMLKRKRLVDKRDAKQAAKQQKEARNASLY